MIEHNTLLYDDLRDPVARLQGRSGPALAAFWPYAGDGEDAPEASEAEAYSALMASSQGMIATEVLSAYDFSKHRRVMDVGGGNGAFLAALADAAPGPNLALCDLPEVARLAEARFRRRPDALRFTVHAVDFLKTPCPPMPISLPWFVYFMTRMTTALSAFWPGLPRPWRQGGSFWSLSRFGTPRGPSASPMSISLFTSAPWAGAGLGRRGRCGPS